jgi:hypothetical protein
MEKVGARVGGKGCLDSREDAAAEMVETDGFGRLSQLLLETLVN